MRVVTLVMLIACSSLCSAAEPPPPEHRANGSRADARQRSLTRNGFRCTIRTWR